MALLFPDVHDHAIIAAFFPQATLESMRLSPAHARLPELRDLVPPAPLKFHCSFYDYDA
jgi:hypothetical protein